METEENLEKQWMRNTLQKNLFYCVRVRGGRACPGLSVRPPETLVIRGLR